MPRPISGSADLIFTPQNLNLSLTEPYLAGDHHLYNSTIDYADPLTYNDTRIIYNLAYAVYKKASLSLHRCRREISSKIPISASLQIPAYLEPFELKERFGSVHSSRSSLREPFNWSKFMPTRVHYTISHNALSNFSLCSNDMCTSRSR
jgi:hypothetical protein